MLYYIIIKIFSFYTVKPKLKTFFFPQKKCVNFNFLELKYKPENLYKYTYIYILYNILYINYVQNIIKKIFLNVNFKNYKFIISTFFFLKRWRE